MSQYDSDKDKLRLAAEPSVWATAAEHQKVWKLLIVDDEDEVHIVTRLALDGFEYDGRRLELLNAFSGAEAIRMITDDPEIAVILLDVVMETDQAGLEVAKYIRETLRNRFVRIILRTGQPGQAPEYEVIRNYDINDYKEKTELTRQKLYTAVYTGLSSYRDLVALEGNRRGLVKVIEASAEIFEMRSLDHFAEGVLDQLTALLYLDQDAMVIRASGIAAQTSNGTFDVVAASGRFRDLVGHPLPDQLDAEVLARINQAMEKKGNNYGTDYFAGYYETVTGIRHLLYVSADRPISVPDINLIELFARNVAIAHENVCHMSQQNP